jgi:beta-glucosidase
MLRIHSGAWSALLLVACSGRPTVAFPPGFLWGVSTAAEQSEGNNTTNDWYAYESIGKVPPVGLADNMYVEFDTDSANARAISANAFRFTFEWARFMPTKPADPAQATQADLDAATVAHYHAVIASLKAHGLTPVVTLTHYTLPVWVDNPAAYDSQTNSYTDGSWGGWISPLTGPAFAAYAGLMAQEYGGDVTYWLTENEPEVDLVAGYMAGIWPPGFIDLSLTDKSLPGGVGVSDVLQNMIAGHAAAYHAIKAAEPNAKVSLAHNSIAFEPYTQSAPNVAATSRVQFLYDFLYLDAAKTGGFDTSLIGQGPVEQHPDWANTLDFVGVNYYAHDYVVSSLGLLSPLNAVPCDPVLAGNTGGLLQDLGCPSQTAPEPVGMTDLLTLYLKRYGLPILITENGGNFPASGGKAGYLVQNLVALHQAITQGVTVIGYSYWTLNDDYEWADGYKDHYGLYGVTGFTAGPDGGLPVGVDGGPWEPGPATDFSRVPYEEATSVYAAIADAGAISNSLIVEYVPDGG